MKKKSLNKHSSLILIVSVVIIMLLSGCAETVDCEDCGPGFEYGFLNGLWHGIIAPITFIVSLFKEEVAVYACNNNGNWYNFGFILGIIIIWGGGSNARKAKK